MTTDRKMTRKAKHTKWHIWFFPTHEPTLKKPKEPFFCQRPNTVQTEKLILTDLNRKYNL